ncbi:TonB-dependent receptor [soil metagenome]
MGKKAKFLASVVASVLIVPSAVFAAEDQSATSVSATAANEADTNLGGDTVVTASRRTETLSKVPASIAAFGAPLMDSKGIRNIQDIARNTPGLTFNPAFGNATSISIRGISGAGVATTGIYIDDTPIQVRSLGVSSYNTYPLIFDLERVEVLRGPQGTLFGAGSEGGTVRFITPEPQTSGSSVYARAEVNGIQNGSMGYEAGAAFGTALVEDKIGLRVSAWHQHSGGYIDNVDPITRQMNHKNINQRDADVMRLAVAFKPTERITITPSIYFQKLSSGDIGSIWIPYSNPDKNVFRSANVTRQPSEDKFYLASLKASYEGEGFTVYNNTSYFGRSQNDVYDYSVLIPAYYTPRNIDPRFPNYPAYAEFWQTQDVFNEEVRIQSNSTTSPFKWLIGGFYQRAVQSMHEDIVDPDFPALIAATRNGATVQAVTNSPMLSSQRIYIEDDRSVDTQYAVFADVSYTLFDQLTLNAGVRYAHIPVYASQEAHGPFNAGDTFNAGNAADNSVTPKFNISWQLNQRTMVYATVAKGFRPGGINRLIPYDPASTNPSVITCTQDQDRTGGRIPGTYTSDSLWSYEGGFKAATRDRRFSIDASGYYIKWTNIQISRGACGVSGVGNGGNAEVKGFELSLNARPIDALSVGVNVSYINSTYTTPILVNPTTNLAGIRTNVSTSIGDALVATPWTVTANAQYNYELFTRPTYTRVDYEYRGGLKLTPTINTANSGYDSHNLVPPSYSFITLRSGMKFADDKVDVSLFVQNLTNTHVYLSQRFERRGVYDVMKFTTFTPRTFGITATMRY